MCIWPFVQGVKRAQCRLQSLELLLHSFQRQQQMVCSCRYLLLTSKTSKIIVPSVHIIADKKKQIRCAVIDKFEVECSANRTATTRIQVSRTVSVISTMSYRLTASYDCTSCLACHDKWHAVCLRLQSQLSIVTSVAETHEACLLVLELSHSTIHGIRCVRFIFM